MKKSDPEKFKTIISGILKAKAFFKDSPDIELEVGSLPQTLLIECQRLYTESTVCIKDDPQTEEDSLTRATYYLGFLLGSELLESHV